MKNDILLDYQDELMKICRTVRENENNKIVKASKIISEKIINGGLLFTFGTGHSFLIASDVLHRAGGLACVESMNEPSLSGINQVPKSEIMERVEGISPVTFKYYGLTKQDALIIVSNSGRNAAPIEMAITAKNNNVPVIVITSLEHSEGTFSRYKEGKKLYNFADIVIDNHCPKGDCTMKIDGFPQPVGPSSSVVGMFIIHSIIVKTIEELVKTENFNPPVFRSGNLDGGHEFNEKYDEIYRNRVRSL